MTSELAPLTPSSLLDHLVCPIASLACSACHDVANMIKAGENSETVAAGHGVTVEDV
jgi:hypothetical protein